MLLHYCCIAPGKKYTSRKREKKVEFLSQKLKKKQDGNVLHLKSMPSYIHTVKNNWNLVSRNSEGPNQSAIYHPFRLNFTHLKQKLSYWIRRPKKLDIKAFRDKIALKWDYPGKQKDKSEISGYWLVKTWEIEGKIYRKIKIFHSQGKKSYNDFEVKPNVLYQYKLAAFTKNDKAKGGERRKFSGEYIVLSPYTDEKKSYFTHLQTSTSWSSKTNSSYKNI